jgi:hypothetical protein
MATRAAAAALGVAQAYRADVSATGEQAALILAGLWRQVDPGDPLAAWTPLLTQALGAFTAGQLVAAALADQYVDAALAAQGDPRQALAGVDPAAFAQTGAAGTDLEALLRIPAQRTAYALGQGVDQERALSLGRGLLTMYARTEIADAARTASMAASAARRVGGYVRALRPPSCARCAILAGRWYRYSSGFNRHPHCDCAHLPAENDIGDELVTDTLAAIRDGQVHGLSAAEQQAIALGADPSQVVNARDGMTTAADGRRYTTTGTTRTGVAGARILARDMARAGGAAPGATYRNFTVSRGDLERFQAQYGAALSRGRQFVRTRADGTQTTVAYRRTIRQRPSVEDILATSTSTDDATRQLINYGYLL